MCILGLALSVFLSAEAKDPAGLHDAPPTVVFADFNKGKDLINNLGGESGAWQLDPKDDLQWARATLDTAVRHGKAGASLKIEYSVDSADNAVVGFWTQLRSFDASGYDHLEFWIKGDAAKGFTTIFKVECKKFEKDSDGIEETVKGSYVVKNVTAEWQKVAIPLNVMNGITDWRDVREFVISLEKKRVDKKSGVLYFDDFAFVRTGDPGPNIRDAVGHTRKKAKDALSGEEFAKLLVGRLKGFPSKIVSEKKFPADDRAFLLEIAKDTWRYFDEIVDREYQVPLDYIRLGDEKPVSGTTVIGDYLNVTDIGLYLMCVVSAADLGFITKPEAVRRLRGTLASVRKLEKYSGFPYNYYDITLFERTSNFISFVDSGWLAAGLIVAKNAFSAEIGEECDTLLKEMNFSFFYDPVEGLMYHGFYANINCYSEFHYGALYTEPRAISYLAIGKGEVGKQHWFTLARTVPDSWLWQTQMPKERTRKSYLGCATEGGYYLYEGVKFVPSWGGSMFEALMPTLIINEKALAPNGLGLNDERYVKLQIAYARNVLGYPVFGMSPSSIPAGGYTEFGAKPLGIKGYKAGVVTPHATFLALEFAPEECVKNLRKMLESYRAYGEYGFYDAIDMKTGRSEQKYLCLDQAMSLIALNNYLNNGAIRARFHADPIAKRAEDLLTVENFFDASAGSTSTLGASK